jgi:periplasmic divalent cation tolerance protein
MKDHFIVFVTCPTKYAKKISTELLEKRLVACVNIVPRMKSLYWWKGEIETQTESLLMMKTRKKLLGNVEYAVKKVHPYRVPDIIALPITYGSSKYLQWISEETTRKSADMQNRE